MNDHLGHYELFKEAVTSVLTDTGFTVSELGQKAQLCASKLLEWMTDSKEEAMLFATDLMTKLQQCTRHSRKVTLHTLKERMTENCLGHQMSLEKAGRILYKGQLDLGLALFFINM